ncbi:ABC transporter permease [Saccharopolyspora sp. 6V]|uniref:ABC transporter permease n=1 Tax=Saccharopolyspora sp. 6V TaxID=2877239 RepID=UPI001CD5D9E9|nr:FtsX-like permease family protein [Saccharopolyspora sp. 6V]MCA1195269.1 cell division protein FtsX [Saccharopolyspora sp. 6V]
MSRSRTWIADLVLGIRLAIGDRNTPWGRLALMTIGIGIGVLVLLASAALPNWLDARDQRIAARDMAHATAEQSQVPAAVLGLDGRTAFGREAVEGLLVEPRRPDAPLPAGLDHYPAAGELIVSPALADLLARPGTELLRDRLPGTVTGTIGDDGLLTPGELYYYAGASGLTEWNADYRVDDHFGETHDDKFNSTPETLMLWSIGACALLLPVIVFVISTTRLAEAARQRRLAALRLVGASAWQVRRIASGETLVGATTGVLAGWVLFAVCHWAVDRLEVAGFSAFVDDFTPVWWLAALITAGVPLTTVLIALAALRGAVGDPLGAVRQAMPRRRRLWPRLVPLVLGMVGVTVPWTEIGSSDLRISIPVFAVALVLLSVPLLLPWIVENVARRWHTGPLAWQLALRRLHLTSGTAARSVSAIAVVVTGIIALQTMVASLEQQYQRLSTRTSTSEVNVYGQEDLTGREGLSATRDEIAALPGVRSVTAQHTVSLRSGERSAASVAIADCATISRIIEVGECRDGDAFSPTRTEHSPPEEGQRPLREGERWEIDRSGSNATGPGTIAWIVPPVLPAGPRTPEALNAPNLVLTPAAAAGIPMEIRRVSLTVMRDEHAPPQLLDQIRTAAWHHLPNPDIYESYTEGTDPRIALNLVKYGLLAGALVVFSLIGCSLLVTAVEQIHERARPMAVLGAVGAKRSTLVWSAFLQNAVPMLLALVVAVPVGYVLGGVLMAAGFTLLPAVDLPGMAAVLAFAAVSVLVVTALTAPALSKAMSPDGLHTE